MLNDINNQSISYSKTNSVSPTYVIIEREKLKNIINNFWLHGVLKGMQLGQQNKSIQSVFYPIWGEVRKMEFYDKLLEFNKKYEEKVDKLNNRLDIVKNDVSDMKSDIATLVVKQGETEKTINEIKENIKDISYIKSNINTIVAKMDNLEKEIDRLNEKTDIVKDDVSDIKSDVKLVDQRLKSLEKKSDWMHLYIIYPVIVGIMLTIFQLLIKAITHQ